MNALFRKKYLYLFSAIVLVMTFISSHSVAMDDSYTDLCSNRTLEILDEAVDEDQQLIIPKFEEALVKVISFYSAELDSKRLKETALKDSDSQKTDHYRLYHGVVLEGLNYFAKQHKMIISNCYIKVDHLQPVTALDHFFCDLSEADSMLCKNPFKNLIDHGVTEMNKIIVTMSRFEAEFENFENQYDADSAAQDGDAQEPVNSIATLNILPGRKKNVAVNVEKGAALKLFVNLENGGQATVAGNIISEKGEHFCTPVYNFGQSFPSAAKPGSNNLQVERVVDVVQLADQKEELFEDFIGEFVTQGKAKLGNKEKKYDGIQMKKNIEKGIGKSDSSGYKKYFYYALGGAVFLVSVYLNVFA